MPTPETEIKLSRLNLNLQRYPALGISLIYTALGLLWIFFSDQLLQLWIAPEALTSAQTLKGFLYVLFTGLLLFALASYFTSTLRKQNRHYRILFQENPLPMWICHPETLQILDTNLSACRHYGYEHTDFCRMNLGQLEPESPPLILSILNQSRPATTLKHINQQGQVMDIWISVKDIASGLLVTAHDITPQKQVERQLQRAKLSLEQFRFAITSASILVVMDPESRILEANANLLRLSGQKIPELTGQHLSELAAFSQFSWPELLAQLAQGHQQVRGEMHLSAGWVDFVLLEYGEQTGQPSYLLLGQDITPQKVMKQEQDQLNQMLVQQNQDLHQFTYIVSHNLRAPAANILGLLDIFNHDDLSDPFNQQVLDKLHQTAESLDHVLKDLNEILSHRGSIQRQREWIPLKPLLQEILSSLEYLLPEQMWQLNLDLHDLERLYSVRGYLMSIFTNLINNAIKYRDPKRRLELSITARQVDQQAVFCIQDNGRGMDLERYGHKVFGFYQRFHGDTEGRGLGLYLVKTQIEMLGGQIEVESHLDQGTSFTFQLPLGQDFDSATTD